jgi:hypothetical protein
LWLITFCIIYHKVTQRLAQSYTKLLIRNRTHIERKIIDEKQFFNRKSKRLNKNSKPQNIFQAPSAYPYSYEYRGQYRLRGAQQFARKLR